MVKPTYLNPPLPADTEVADEFFAAVDTIVEIMNRADSMNLTCNFNIPRGQNGKYSATVSITKILKERK